MDFEELLEKYQILLVENNNLKEKIKSLKAERGIPEQPGIPCEFSEHKTVQEIFVYSNIKNSSEPLEKIKLFRSLFKGREDVYAKRWENKKKGTSARVI